MQSRRRTCFKCDNTDVTPHSDKVISACDEHIAYFFEEDTWTKTKIKESFGLSNLICKNCLMANPVFLKINQEPFQLVCYSCAKKLASQTPQNELMFIKAKWFLMVKSYEDLKKYKSIKLRLKTLKNSSQEFIKKNDKFLEKLDGFGKVFEEQVEEVVGEKIRILDDYKEEIVKMIENFKIEAKNDMTSEYSHNVNRSKGWQIATTNADINALLEEKICKLTIRKITEADLDELCNLSFAPINDLLQEIQNSES